MLKDSEKFSDNIYYCDKINTPFIFGITAPKIYIPKGTDIAYLEYIIAHEKYHLKRKDYIIKAFAYLLLCIHFFNPLCYVAFRLMNKDMEMSCDEKVIESFKSIKENTPPPCSVLQQIIIKLLRVRYALLKMTPKAE